MVRKMPQEVVIRPFRSGDEVAFRKLNLEWIERFFVLEEKDRVSLESPKETIIDRGGHIFMATIGDRAVGCCALLALGSGEFEIAKMAVFTDDQGRGIGRRLLAAAIDKARQLNSPRLYLESNHRLVHALRLYESLGFRHIDSTKVKQSPYERADVYMELHLI